MSYLVLHIDIDFIVGTVCTDNGTLYPITNGKEDLLWLYFFNNPHQNNITFGKANKLHFDNSEVNYYGNFFEIIEKEHETFFLRSIKHPVIDLLIESGLLETVRKAYQQKTLDNTNNIPTLITFSLSIGDNAKQKTVDYLKKKGFQIDSYTIPLAELTAYNALNNNVLKNTNSSVVIFLEATNSTLHLMKLSFSDNYFLMNGKVISYEGKGFDPRKQALLRFVVNEANKAIGALFSEKEKMEECKRLAMKSDEWLKKLDATNPNMPYYIRDISFSKMPSSKRDVLVRKSDLESDTGSYIQELKDIFNAFRSDNVSGNTVTVFLLGDCFKSDRIKNSFEQIIGKDKLYIYANKDIHEILAMYLKIDINRYASEEARIRERAKAEEQKQAEQRALEDRQHKEQAEEAQRQAEMQKTEQNRKEAQKLFERAVELETKGKLEDARVNIENAISLDKTSREYKQFLSDLIEKINNLNAKNDLYKSYLSKAEKLLVGGELEKALEEYEAAKFVFDNAEIIQKIVEVKRLIKDQKQQEAKLAQLFSETQSLITQSDFLKAKIKVDEILFIDKENSKAKSFLSKIEKELQQQEKEQQEKENNEKCEKIIIGANNLFDKEEWAEAQKQYEMALELCPQEKSIKDRIEQCVDAIKEKDSVFSGLMLEATIFENKGKFKEALSCLEEALSLKSDDTLLSRIKVIKNKIKFDFGESPNNPPNRSTQQKENKPKEKENDVFIRTKADKKQQQNIEDNFLGNYRNKISVPKTKETEDDFLGIEKNKKNENQTKNKKADFDDW